MNKWVLLEHKVYFSNSLDVHYDFLVENGIDCLTWKFSKIPLLNEGPVGIIRQPNHRFVWLFREQHELSRNRGFVRRVDQGKYRKVDSKLDSRELRLILDGKLLNGLFEISGNFCTLTE